MDVDRFPPLASELHLPLCDKTALDLSRALLNDHGASSREVLIGTIHGDPFFAFWCACRAGEYFHQLPTSGEIAEWFLSAGFVHLGARSNDAAVDELLLNDLLTRAVTVALLASRNSPDESATSQTPYLLGLLIESTMLFRAMPSNDQTGSLVVRELIPKWLANSLEAVESRENPPDELPEANVREAHLAVEAGVNNLEPETFRIISESCREASERFQTQIPAARGTLPALCKKLQRLHKLEFDFQATLEQEKLASLKQLAYGASHEINNPLANISTRAQTLLRGEEDPERRRQLSTINSQAFRAHEMISDMMLFAHPPKLQLVETNVRVLVEQVIEESIDDARQQSTQLTLAADSASPIWEIDSTQIAVALKALVRNSIESLGSGGQVTVTLQLDVGDKTSKEALLEICVTDDGPGISNAVRKHLFDPFFSGREAGRGLGFGLAKCWRIVELHGGEILVEDRPLHGTSITVRLPRVKLQEERAGDSEPARLEIS